MDMNNFSRPVQKAVAKAGLCAVLFLFVILPAVFNGASIAVALYRAVSVEKAFVEVAQETRLTVVDVRTVTDGDASITETVVEYMANNEQHTNAIQIGDDYAVGDTFTGYYDPNDVLDVRLYNEVGASNTLFIAALIWVAVWIVIGIVVLRLTAKYWRPFAEELKAMQDTYATQHPNITMTSREPEDNDPYKSGRKAVTINSYGTTHRARTKITRKDVAIFGGIGALIILGAGIFMIRELQYDNRAKEGEGIVTSEYVTTEERRDSDGDTYTVTVQHLTISYVIDGVEYTTTDSVQSERYSEGDAIYFTYDPENKQDIRLNDNTKGKYIVFALFMLMGVLFIATPLWGYLRSKKQTDNLEE